MLGIDPMTQRDRMAEGIDVILPLFRGETVTEKTEWYTLVGKTLNDFGYRSVFNAGGFKELADAGLETEPG